MSSDKGQRRLSTEQRGKDSHLLDLQMQARYHRDRHRLYSARMRGSRPTSLSKLRELERRREVAESSLRHAQETEQGTSPGRSAHE
jgi:hypothetical protein